MQRSTKTLQAKETARHAVIEALRDAIIPAISMVSNLVIGTSMFLETGSELLRVGAVVLVLVGAAHSTELARGASFWRRGAEKPDAESPEETSVFTSNLEGANRSRRLVLRKAFERRTLAENRVSEKELGVARDLLSGQASFFYLGLLAGILGACVAVYGVLLHLYLASLMGSIISAVGLVTLACALVSAEEASEAA